MNKSKRGRKAYPEHMRGKCTSLRLRPDRLEVFKYLGGVKWLNTLLDIEIANLFANHYNMDLESSIDYLKDFGVDRELYLKILEENNKKLTERTELTEITDDYRRVQMSTEITDVIGESK